MNASLFKNTTSLGKKLSDPDVLSNSSHAEEFGLFDSVFHEVSNAIAIISREKEDQTPTVIDVNHHFELISGYQFNEIQGQNLYNFIEDSLSKHTRHVIEAALDSRQAAILFCPWQNKNGEILNVDMTIRPFSSDNSGSRFICVLRENNDEKDSRDQAAKEIKHNLLAAMHHNFKTPLNGILGYSEIMMSELMGPIGQESYKNYAQDIHGAGKDLLQLIDNLLDIKELETTEFALQEEIFSVKDMISECLIKSSADAKKGKIDLSCQYDQHIPDLFGDKSRLQQAIHSIIDNAMKFTQPNGKITLTAKQQGDGAYIISCKDNGAGMASQQLAKIFCHDTHLSNIYSNPTVGIGFGLSYVKQIIEKHDGTASIISSVGCGTTVTLYFPAKRLVK